MLGDDLEIGDLVTHVLYGRGWIGIIVDFKQGTLGTENKRDRKALVQLQPGTEHANFFKRSITCERVNDSLGYVSVNWLFVVKEKNANTRPSRNKTPQSGRKSKKIS
jgi:hypothetical protein